MAGELPRMILTPYFPLPMEQAGPVHYREWRDQHDMRIRGQRMRDYAARRDPDFIFDIETVHAALFAYADEG